MICTAHGLIGKEELPQYQKEHISDMLAQLNEQLSKSNKTADIEDVVFTDEEEE